MNYRLFFALLAFPIIAAAQPKQGKWSVIPKVGVTISKVSGDKIFYLQEGGGGGVSAQESNSKYKAGFLGGVDVQYQVTSVFGVSAGVFYQQQGTRFDDFTMLGADEKGGESVGSQRLHLGYLARHGERICCSRVGVEGRRAAVVADERRTLL